MKKQESPGFSRGEQVKMPQLIEALDIALSKRHVTAREVFRYTGGIVRNWIADLDRLTAEELAKGAGNGEN